ncbi:hypothetical protein [Paramuribaculum intestinale]|nr:hypothetical protein [Paramuribaculum intestinale]MCX4330270.1 hypothetical protein [Paramuribaculum intestinale]
MAVDCGRRQSFWFLVVIRYATFTLWRRVIRRMLPSLRRYRPILG